jgi:hypothetical protein
MSIQDRETGRLAEAQRLFSLFRPERFVHLFLCASAFALLLWAAALMIMRQHAGKSELALIFGSGGLVTYTSNRLLVMWSDMVRIVFGK